ncbi:hypothetical protein [Pseudomonas sp. C11]|uniref:hypothetical protein n=1 Tax=Pseudomonas sp. C11 TaxID=3075550 RepID=UPI002AFFEFD6|nr:hypothetical protein [Pseudomonas sp. C11]
MRRIGLVLLLIVSLVLPSFGGMAFSMPVQPCPMQSGDHQGHAMVDAPCCDYTDQTDGLADKSPCKSGQECKTASLLQTVVIKTFTPRLSRPEALPSQSVIERAPSELWRPPRFA